MRTRLHSARPWTGLAGSFLGAAVLVGALCALHSVAFARADHVGKLASVPSTPVTQGGIGALRAEGTSSPRCALRTTAPGHGKKRRYDFVPEGSPTQLEWRVPRNAAPGRWKVKIACDSKSATAKIRVTGEPSDGSRLIAPGSLHVTPMEPSHDDLPDAPPGVDPAGLSQEPQDDWVAAPDFAMPFRCGETWRAATYPNHGRTGNDYPVDFNHDDEVFELTAAVVASADGVVRVSQGGFNDGYGRLVVVDHGAGWTTWYAHLSARFVEVGDLVARGDQLGVVGSTGNSTAPHLHYEQRLNGGHQHVRFDGQPITYNYVYNGTAMVSGNCEPSGPTGPDID
jgi:murein DD-endopeptidase MepM/ murein hydrolase activator NlpD